MTELRCAFCNALLPGGKTGRARCQNCGASLDIREGTVAVRKPGQFGRRSLQARRRTALIVGLIVVAILAVAIGGSLVANHPSARFTLTVFPRNQLGDFNAIAHNGGKARGTPTCTVRAFDQFGNRIGYDIFTLDPVEPGADLPWNGHIQVNELVDHYGGEC